MQRRQAVNSCFALCIEWERGSVVVERHFKTAVTRNFLGSMVDNAALFLVSDYPL